MAVPYVNAVELDIVPAEYENFKAAVRENAAASVNEAGCRQFDVLFEERPATTYDDDDALAAHRTTPHFKRYAETTAPMIERRVARHLSPIAFNSKAR